MDCLTTVCLVWLSLVSILAAKVPLPTTENPNEDDPDYPKDVMDNLVEESSTSTSTEQSFEKETKEKEFRSFIAVATRNDEQQQHPALFLLPRFHPHGEDRNRNPPPLDGRALLFKDSPKGRPVPLTLDNLLQDKCQTLPFEQTVTHPGCDNATVHTNFCYGLCSSLFVPLMDDVIATCNSCAPIKIKSVSVQLNCPGREHSLRKHVKVVNGCACVGCDSKGGVYG